MLCIKRLDKIYHFNNKNQSSNEIELEENVNDLGNLNIIGNDNSLGLNVNCNTFNHSQNLDGYRKEILLKKI